ncbi:MAG: hypothetical protein WCN81_16260, partial [Actinomycetes bacterium]
MLVSASAGAGKTTVLRQWSESAGRPAAWLRLDKSDQIPSAFLAHLVSALHRVAPIDTRLLGQLRSPAPAPVQAIVPALCAAVGTAEPFLLLVDDAQNMRARPCWALLETLLAAVATGSQIAIGTRVDPPLPLARMRAAGEVYEVRFEQLALSLEEIMELLADHGRVASAETGAELLKVTEGWAAGVSLATLCGPDGDLVSGLTRLGRSGDGIGRYFAGEVLAGQPESVQTFLLQTSILDSLTPGACQAVCDQEDSWRILEGLSANNLLVSCTGSESTQCRYQRLFGEFLQGELRRRHPREVRSLHRKAAAYFQAEGDIGQAVRHWLAAGETRRAGDLVSGSWPASVLSGESRTVRSLLGLFSTRAILQSPSLTLTAAWVHGVSGASSTGAFWLRAAAISDADGPSPDGAASLGASRAMLRGMAGHGGVTQMCRDAELVASLETQRGSSRHAMANLL